MNRKIKFTKENVANSNTISYEIINNDLKRLKEWERLYKELVFNINELTILTDRNGNFTNYLIYNGIKEQIMRLNEMRDNLLLIIKIEKENIIYRCPKMADYL